ncbi:arylsulfatase [candidate division KSB1 bacterium]
MLGKTHTGHTYIRGNSPVEGYQLAIPEDTVTIPKLLKQAGYTTGLVGKWGLGGPDTSGAPNKQGFDYFYGYLGQAQAHFYYPPHLWENNEKVILEGNSDGKKETYSHDLIAEKSLEFIKQNKDKPFFLYLALTIPHAEIIVPEDSMVEYKDKFEEKPYIGRHYGSQETPRAAFAGMVSRMDRDVGRVLDLLKELGIEEKTLVIFSSDNGPHQEGGHDPEFFNSGGFLRGIKRDLYEGGIRVPMTAYWPGQINPGRVSDHISAFWDLLPACCELAGVDPPEGIDGVSFVPELIGYRQPSHEYLYWEFHERGGKQAVRMRDWKAVRLNVKKDTEGPIELYNLREDQREEKNIAEQNPEIVKRIEKIMREARTSSEKFPLSDKM